MKRALVWVGLIGLVGCQTPATVSNPLLVAEADFETVWNTAVDVVNDHFAIAREDRRGGEIVSAPLPAATLAEPWYVDSRTFRDRLEATLQTMRRLLTVRVNRRVQGGYAIEVEVRKELEELDTPLRAGVAGGPFLAQQGDRLGEPIRLRSGASPQVGWIDRGRDVHCEQYLLRRIDQAFHPDRYAKLPLL